MDEDWLFGRMFGFRSYLLVRPFVALILALLFMPGRAVGQSPSLAIEQPWQTMDQEHLDRMGRLMRLSKLDGVSPPEFEQYYIPPSEHHLSGYPLAMPVLRVIFRDHVFFDFDRDELRSEASSVLGLMANSLRKEPPDVTVFVAGHTDAIGSPSYNLNLGLRRAKAVAVALAALGVNRAQIFLVSFGEAVPIASNETDEGRALNRRVEFLFAAQPAPIAAWLSRQPTLPCAAKASEQLNECPIEQSYRAISVRLVAHDESASLDTSNQTVMLDNTKRGVPQSNKQNDIVLGEKVVDINLKSRIFTIPPPE